MAEAKVAVTTPASAAIRLRLAIEGLSLIATVALAATTLVEASTKAALTSDVVPLMFIALETVTVPPVLPPSALKSVASLSALFASLTEIVI